MTLKPPHICLTSGFFYRVQGREGPARAALLAPEPHLRGCLHFDCRPTLRDVLYFSTYSSEPHRTLFISCPARYCETTFQTLSREPHFCFLGASRSDHPQGSESGDHN